MCLDEKGYVFIMGRKPKLSKEEKLSLVKERLENEIPIKILSLKYGIHPMKIYDYISSYLKFGDTGLDPVGSKNRTHTTNFKLQVVQEFLKEESKRGLSIKYQISKSVVSRWIKQYNSNQLKDYTPKGEIYTMTSKKYSKEEKLEIIKECIKSNKDYKSICSKYSIKYGLLYQWVLAYEKKEKLRPLEEAQSNEERLKILLTLKDMEIQSLQAELEILKKNDEIYEAIQRKKSKRNT